MSYRVTRDESAKPRIVLKDEPPFCRALQAAPISREPELDTDTWLVMCFAAWSVPDIQAIQTALDVARHFNGRLKLGVRPFDTQEEHAAWCPTIEDETGSPVWVLLRDGMV